ncbi:hypothetical protein LWP59_21610 [Amycolatopsis acidiphila]|uniref:Uncharacterized protein n=1 Tax=Amycolatopsis acidiphila TaxID=715473 RepID=A0A558A559_9PSEU|nr:hypothetical protein [Amycolatopsis acidiphila]TVT19419.1 hypothetical protein FNH06_24360 [Amycolatopsis acidiphila]UIJ56770.1 hypothetical protein LWP59_21610 [Amycolatopsis acidiphila]GHG55222.1 hypothetical protein GCM10017788_05600 [Amycolatopsis acidiphila]
MRDNGFAVTAAPRDIFEETAAVLDQRRRAVRAVASSAADADDCALLLDALGLKPAEGVATVPGPRSAE